MDLLWQNAPLCTGYLGLGISQDYGPVKVNHKMAFVGFDMDFFGFSNSVAQSISTHYSSLSDWPDIFLGSVTFLKKVQNMGCKKQDNCYSKREEGAWPLLFLNKNDPVFCTLLFAPHIMDLIFFQRRKPTHVFKTRIVGAD